MRGQSVQWMGGDRRISSHPHQHRYLVLLFSADQIVFFFNRNLNTHFNGINTEQKTIIKIHWLLLRLLTTPVIVKYIIMLLHTVFTVVLQWQSVNLRIMIMKIIMLIMVPGTTSSDEGKSQMDIVFTRNSIDKTIK